MQVCVTLARNVSVCSNFEHGIMARLVVAVVEVKCAVGTIMVFSGLRGLHMCMYNNYNRCCMVLEVLSGFRPDCIGLSRI